MKLHKRILFMLMSLVFVMTAMPVYAANQSFGDDDVIICQTTPNNVQLSTK